MADMVKDFGTWLKNEREKKNITIKELSEISLVQETFIVRIENGKRKNISTEVKNNLINSLSKK